MDGYHFMSRCSLVTFVADGRPFSTPSLQIHSLLCATQTGPLKLAGLGRTRIEEKVAVNCKKHGGMLVSVGRGENDSG